ncbi:hypothetical protein XBKB1_4250004 [Xenorhabdus bovienii str. kraussei Becker Underwood]|uniref:Uncharacterized protein n=1 Tax=Xenorhabdus bovienii str. kraussei Becker Underwood TaxID=1398204 RepID=A0A077PYW0_XENBV|nr:hypothetical protein XBKB1_4250004 [Xenorhabdus bovienii str. kraussei Becker Underwood]
MMCAVSARNSDTKKPPALTDGMGLLIVNVVGLHQIKNQICLMVVTLRPNILLQPQYHWL